MRSIFSHIGVIVSIFGLLRVAQTLPDLTFQTLPTSGQWPAFDTLENEVTHQIQGARFDPVGQRFHVVLGDSWYRMDLNDRHWTRISIQHPTELERPVWDVIPGTSTLLAWDSGVGRVVRIDSTDRGQRVDLSFNHRNQYGHIPYVDPLGHIYAVGGSGLFSIKNFAVHFFPETGTWHRSTGHELLLDDPMMYGGFAIRDPQNPFVFIVSNVSVGAVAETSIHGLNLKTGEIDPIHRIPFIQISAWLHAKWRHPFSASVRDGTHRFAFSIGKDDSRASNTSPSTLGILDFDTKHLIRIQGVLPQNTHPVAWHLILHYDETDSTLYSLNLSYPIADSTMKPILTSAKIDVGAVKAALKNGIEPHGGSFAMGVYTKSVAVGLLIALVLVAGFTYWKRRTAYLSELSTEVTPEIAPLTLSVNPLLLNGQRWEARFGDDFPLERNLLELLTQAMANGQPVLSSDVVDKQLIPHHPSPDYIRKTRNLTRKRLEESLQSAFPTAEGQSYILTHREVLDKRKTMLQLNPKCISINPPE